MKYRENAFMDFGKEFSTEKLSAAMTNVSLGILGWSLQVSSWRHINIALKRKHCGHSMSILAGDASNPIHALQSGHSVATENRIYGLTAESLLGAPEDIIHAYLDASTEWQRLFQVVPGGVRNVLYTHGRMHHFEQLKAKGYFTSKVFKEVEKAQLPTRNSGDILAAITNLQQLNDENHTALLNKVQQLQQHVTSLEAEITKLTASKHSL